MGSNQSTLPTLRVDDRFDSWEKEFISQKRFMECDLPNPVDIPAVPYKLGEYEALFATATHVQEPPAPPAPPAPVQPDQVDDELALLLLLASAVGLPRQIEREL